MILLTKEPFTEYDDSDSLFLDAMSQSLIFHYEHSDIFKQYCIKKNFNPYHDFTLDMKFPLFHLIYLKN